MNKIPSRQSSITTHEDLLAERKRLETLITINKALLIRELDAVKTEITNKIKPALNAMEILRHARSFLTSPTFLSGLSIFLLNRFIQKRISLKSHADLTHWTQLLLKLMAAKVSKQ
jgi:hypothetical protein